VTVIFIMSANVDRKVMNFLLYLIFLVFIYTAIEVFGCLLFEETIPTQISMWQIFKNWV